MSEKFSSGTKNYKETNYDKRDTGFFFRKLQTLGHLKHRRKSPIMIKPDFQASVITIMFHFNDTLYAYYYIFCKL